MLPQINTIYSYFRAIKEKDIDKLVDMFEDDAVIQEPFSKEAQLRDKRNFKSFFQIVCMANEELEHDLFFEDATIMELPYYAHFKKGKQFVHDSAFDLVLVQE